jgi:cysteine desulfurase
VDLERFYLDYNATSPLSQSVSDWLKSGDLLFANPSSQHSRGKASRKVINESRAEIFSTFNKSESDSKLFFHSGATEAFASIASSFAETARLSGKDLLICTARTDHPCVSSLNGKYFGSHVKFLEIKKARDLSALHQENYDILKDRKDNNPDLMILYHHLWVHNETGLVCPLEELSLLKQIPDLFIHVDAVQAVGKIPEWQKLSEGDLWTFSAHKFGALKGIGFTLLNKTTPFQAFITGGGQQNGMRSGTENPQGAKSVYLALTDIKKIDVKKNADLRNDLVNFMDAEMQNLGKLLSPEAKRSSSNTIYFYLNHLNSDMALALFDLNGLEISAGSACFSGAAKASDILLHMGLNDVARNGLRLSFSFNLNSSELAKIKGQLKVIFGKLRASSL